VICLVFVDVHFWEDLAGDVTLQDPLGQLDIKAGHDRIWARDMKGVMDSDAGPKRQDVYIGTDGNSMGNNAGYDVHKDHRSAETRKEDKLEQVLNRSLEYCNLPKVIFHSDEGKNKLREISINISFE
jgi:hypothetical protein